MTSVRSTSWPVTALRTGRSIQARKAARVLPEPVGAEISVVLPARMCGQPSDCGSVGVPKRPINQSRTSECIQARSGAMAWGGARVIALRLLYIDALRRVLDARSAKG